MAHIPYDHPLTTPVLQASERANLQSANADAFGRRGRALGAGDPRTGLLERDEERGRGEGGADDEGAARAGVGGGGRESGWVRGGASLR